MTRLPSAMVALLLATPAWAHETLHEIARGKAVAVRAFFADGEALAYRAAEVYSPADPEIPFQKGRTDREGWVAFVPNAPGRWRVKVMDETGHGLELEVEADAASGQAPPPPPGTLAFVLRPLVGLAAIGALFALLLRFHRRRAGGA